MTTRLLREYVHQLVTEAADFTPLATEKVRKMTDAQVVKHFNAHVVDYGSLKDDAARQAAEAIADAAEALTPIYDRYFIHTEDVPPSVEKQIFGTVVGDILYDLADVGLPLKKLSNPGAITDAIIQRLDRFRDRGFGLRGTSKDALKIGRAHV